MADADVFEYIRKVALPVPLVWQKLYDSCWGHPAAALTDGVLHLARSFDVNEKFPLHIRPEYQHVHQGLLERAARREKAVVLVGQPGIGKSIFLRYAALAECEAKRSFFWTSTASTEAILFSNEGVFMLRHEHVADVHLSQRMLLLCDADADAVPAALYTPGSRHLLVFASSPPQSRFREMAKQTRARFYCFEPWRSREFVAFLSLLYAYRHLVSSYFEPLSSDSCLRLSSLPAPSPLTSTGTPDDNEIIPDDEDDSSASPGDEGELQQRVAIVASWLDETIGQDRYTPIQIYAHLGPRISLATTHFHKSSPPDPVHDLVPDINFSKVIASIVSDCGVSLAGLAISSVAQGPSFHHIFHERPVRPWTWSATLPARHVYIPSVFLRRLFMDALQQHSLKVRLHMCTQLESEPHLLGLPYADLAIEHIARRPTPLHLPSVSVVVNNDAEVETSYLPASAPVSLLQSGLYRFPQTAASGAALLVLRGGTPGAPTLPPNTTLIAMLQATVGQRHPLKTGGLVKLNSAIDKARATTTNPPQIIKVFVFVAPTLPHAEHLTTLDSVGEQVGEYGFELGYAAVSMRDLQAMVAAPKPDTSPSAPVIAQFAGLGIV